MSGNYLDPGAVASKLAAQCIDVTRNQETVQPVEVLQYMTDAFSTSAQSDSFAHKGCNGCIGVLGGCSEATGPPHFAAMSALRAGVDIARIFTTASAAASIRCYSPDTYVHPVCKESSDMPEPRSPEQHASAVSKAVAEIESWFSRLHCLVVGSGLGRDPLLLDIAEGVIQAAVRAGLSLVLDGDAIFLVARKPALVKHYSQCVITPSLNEYRRFSHALGVSINKGDRAQKLQEVVAALDGPTIVSKGPVDAIANMQYTSICNATSSAKRCSGQGDVLAGLLAALIPVIASTASPSIILDPKVRIQDREMAGRSRCVLGALDMHNITHMACLVARSSAARAHEVHRRSMLTSDIVPLVGKVLSELTPQSSKGMRGGKSSIGGSVGDANERLSINNMAHDFGRPLPGVRE